MITSTWPHTMNYLVYGHEFGDFFNAIVASCEIGSVKPDEKIFNAILERLDLKGDEVAIAGDSLRADIQGGSKVGMKTVLYDPKRKYLKKPVNADYPIFNLRETLDIF